MPPPVRLLVNPSAGGGRALAAQPAVEAELARLGLTVHAEHTRSLRDAERLAVEAARAGETVVTLSGDGLIGAVAGALRGHPDAVIGVLPGGRGNDFARALGIPLDPVAACAVIAAGTPRPIDVGELAGPAPRTFVGIASLGFDSVANRLANEAPGRLGRFVYVYAALRALTTWRPATFDVAVDRDRRTLPGWTVAACNATSYGGGMLAAPGARLDDGLLDMVFFAPRTRLQFLRAMRRVFKGTHVDLDFVSVRRGRELWVDADRPFDVYADGDLIGTLPATIRVVPAAVTVLAPA